MSDAAEQVLTDAYLDRVASSLPPDTFPPYVTRVYAQALLRARSTIAALLDENRLLTARVDELAGLVRDLNSALSDEDQP